MASVMQSDGQTVTAHYLDTLTKDRWQEHFEYYVEGNFYYWREGNFACDCNRSLKSPRSAYGCNQGNNIILIEKLTPFGKPDEILYSEQCGDSDCPCHWGEECSTQKLKRLCKARVSEVFTDSALNDPLFNMTQAIEELAKELLHDVY